MTEAPEAELREDFRRSCCDLLRRRSSSLLSRRWCTATFLGDRDRLRLRRFLVTAVPSTAPARPAPKAVPKPDLPSLELELDRDRDRDRDRRRTIL
jgi:hypothetical protein